MNLIEIHHLLGRGLGFDMPCNGSWFSSLLFFIQHKSRKRC